VIFNFRGRDLLAAMTHDGRLLLFDTAALKTPLDRSAPFSSAGYQAGALASWQDWAGTRWILAPAGGDAAAGANFRNTNGAVKNGAIAAWKVVEKGGSLGLEPGWLSRDLVAPLPPVTVNGVVFALSSGEFRSDDPKLAASERARRSGKAVLYALDGITGKELWNSGDTIGSFTHSGGLAAGGSRVYVSTYDGTQYVFGFRMETLE
jgi:outer membrane protein assembly factor BamB